ncbi:MAG: ABC transporter substrate-binding protein [Candidatus Bipolaricaulota bacterium]|nr:ABC transporter substrate-binding protein [Candidatus Bipolaricaulota bacterium]MDW8030413.1 ABC transporter substrate-binding protein [Candidatus Bipolaricaulota bacterium]
MKRRTFLKGIGLAVGAMTLSGVFRGPIFAQPPPVMTIGTLLDSTGPLAEFGPAERKGADLAASQLNEAARAVFGGPIVRLVHEDPGFPNFALVVDRAKKLVTVDKAVGLVGGLASSASLAIAREVSKPFKVPQISPASTSPLLTVEPDDDFLFRSTASDALQGVVLAMLAAGEIKEAPVKYRTAATLFVNNPYGQGLSDRFAKSFEKRGGRVLAQVPHPEDVLPSYAAELRRALTGNPDVLVAISYPGHANVYLKEAVEVFRYKSFLFVDGTRSADMIKALGFDILHGFYGTVASADPQDPNVKKFEEEFKKVYGEIPPIPYIDTTYDAVAALGLAIAKAIADGVRDITGVVVRDNLRPVSNPPGTVVGVAGFVAALQALRNKQDINYEGAGSALDFDAAGDVVSPIEIWQYNKDAPGGIKTITLVKQVPPE